MAKTTEVENGLLFVVGCGRSGTTLLKSILNMHQSVFFPPETFFFTSIFPFDKDAEDSFDTRLDQLLSKWWIQDLNISREQILEHFKGEDSAWEKVFLALLAALADRENGQFSVYGEKTPSHVQYTSRFFDIYPNCKVIHMIRDPRAVYASYKKSPVGTNQIAGVVKEWDRAITAHFNNRENDRYLSLRYEDLVSNPEQELRKACDFLSLDFIPNMLEFHARSNKGFSDEQVHHKNTLSPLFTSSIDAWEKSLTKNQIAIIDGKLGHQMKRLGYMTSNYPVMLPELRFQVSRIQEFLSRNLIRRTRQKIKKFRALRRIRHEKHL